MHYIQYYVYSFDLRSKFEKLAGFLSRMNDEPTVQPVKIWTGSLTGSVTGPVF